MKKEVIIAVLIGLVLGLIITYGVYLARKSLIQPINNSENTITASATPTPTNSASMIITAPQDESIVSTDTVTVAGTTVANSFIVVIVDDNETISTADESGNFSVEVGLAEDSNIITIFSLDQDGVPSQEELTIIYHTDPLTAEEANTATDSAQTSE